MGLETASLPCMADLEAQLAGLRCAWSSLTSPEAPAPGAQRHAKNAGGCSPGRPSPQPPGPRVGTRLLPAGSQQQQQPPKRRMHEGAFGHFPQRAQQASAEVTERSGALPSSGYPDLASAAWQEVVQAAQQPRRHGQGQQAEAARARPDVQGARAVSRHMAGETSQAGSRSLCARQGAGDSGASLRASHAAARLAALRQAQTSRRAVPLVQQPAAERWEQRQGREARLEGSQQRQGFTPQRRQTWSGSSGRRSPEQASLGAHPAAAGVQGTAPPGGQACVQQRRQHGGTGREQDSEDAENLWRDWLRAPHDVGAQAAPGRQKRRARRPQWHIDPALPPVTAGEGEAPLQAAAEAAAQPALPSLRAPPAARDSLGHAAAGPAAPTVVTGPLQQGHRDLDCHPAAPGLVRPLGQHSCPSIGAPAYSQGPEAQDTYSSMQQSVLPQLPPTFGAGPPGSTPRPCQQLPGQYLRHPQGPGAAAGRHLLPSSGRAPLQALPWQNGSRPESQEQQQQAVLAQAAHGSPSCDSHWPGGGHQPARSAQPADWAGRQEASLGHAGAQPRRHSEGSWQTHHHQPTGELDKEQHSVQEWPVQLAVGCRPFGQRTQAAAGECALEQHGKPLPSGASLWPQGADVNSQQQHVTTQQAHVGASQEPASGLAACLAAALAHICRDIPLVEDQEHVDARMQQVRQRLHVSAAATPGQQEEDFPSPQAGQRRASGRRPVGDGGFEGLSLGEVLANPPRSRQQAPGLASGSGTDEEAQPEQVMQSPPAVDPWNGLGLGEVLQPRRQSLTDGGNRPRVGRRPPASASPSYADFASDLQAAGLHSRNRLAVHLGRPARSPAAGSTAAGSFGARRPGAPAGQQHQGPAEASAAAVHSAGLGHQVDSQGFPIIDAAQLEQLLGSGAPHVPNMQRRQQARAALSLLERFQFAAPARHRSAAAAEDAQDCSICLDAFCNKQFLRRFIGCKHAFHDKCISEWMATGDIRCPLCRWDPIKCAWPDQG